MIKRAHCYLLESGKIVFTCGLVFWAWGLVGWSVGCSRKLASLRVGPSCGPALDYLQPS